MRAVTIEALPEWNGPVTFGVGISEVWRATHKATCPKCHHHLIRYVRRTDRMVFPVSSAYIACRCNQYVFPSMDGSYQGRHENYEVVWFDEEAEPPK